MSSQSILTPNILTPNTLTPNTLLTAEEFNILHPEKCYKLLPKNMIMNRNYLWKIGNNTLPKDEAFNPSGICKGGGLYFTDLKNLNVYVETHDLIGEITITPGTKVWTENCATFKAYDVNLTNVMTLFKFFLLNPDVNNAYLDRVISKNMLSLDYDIVNFIFEKSQKIANEFITDLGRADNRFMFLVNAICFKGQHQYDLKKSDSIYLYLLKIITENNFPISYITKNIDKIKNLAILGGLDLKTLKMFDFQNIEIMEWKLTNNKKMSNKNIDLLYDDDFESNVLQIINKLSDLEKKNIIEQKYHNEFSNKVKKIMLKHYKTLNLQISYFCPDSLDNLNKKNIKKHIIDCCNDANNLKLSKYMVDLMLIYNSSDIYNILINNIKLNDTEIITVANILSTLNNLSKKIRRFVTKHKTV